MRARPNRSADANLARLILDGIPGFVHTMTPDGRMEMANQRLLDFFGVTFEELRDWKRFTHPDDIGIATARIEKAIRTGTLVDSESRGLRADGVYRWFQVRAVPMRDADGVILRWCFLLTDIDDRKRMEEALRAKERDLRLILDTVPALVHTLTPDGEVEHVNRQILDFFGRSAEELRDWSTVTHPDDIQPVGQVLAHALAAGAPFEFESRGRRADGTFRWLQSRGMPLRDAEGKIVRWYDVVTDIHDRKLAEEALRNRESQLQLMVDSIPGLIATNTAAGAVEHVNKTLLDYTGKTLEELRDWGKAVHPDDLPRVAALWQHSIETCDPFNVEVRVRRADGAYRWFQCSGLPLRGSDGKVIRWYNLLTDIEERLTTEEALRNTRTRLSRATQVATAGELAASIAHEINQPLAAIVTNGHTCHSWLTADPPNIARALVSLERIIRDAKAAADVIQRIRALYRQIPVNKDEIDINDVIEEVCSLIAIEARRRSIQLRTDLQPALPRVVADRVQLQQVLANLSRNAVEAMETVHERTKELKISSLHEDRQVIVQVCDTGIGMQDYSTAFEPFFTTKAEGMGMGLAICRSIVEAHGGHLWATRAAPCGSVFSFSLPITVKCDSNISDTSLGSSQQRERRMR